MAEEEPLESLLTRSRAGDTEAFGGIVRQWQGQVRGLVAMCGVERDWIDDAVQETFIAAYGALKTYDGERPFGPWLNGVARNVVRRHRERSIRERRFRAGAVGDWLRERCATADIPEPAAVADLQHCLELLPRHLRELVDLRYGQDLDSEEIATRTGRTATAVRMALVRIRRGLGECLAKAQP